MEIVIDNREKNDYISHLNKKINCKLTIDTLNIGDVLFKYNDEEYLLIERKTINDLASSISDGRYHEQKSRLLSAKDQGINIIYLIEGIYEQNKYMTYETYKGCIFNTISRDQIPVYLTNNFEETIDFICELSKRLPDNYNKSKKLQNYTTKVIKKENLTPNICYINQLKQIPGISDEIANAIIKEYSTMPKLIQKYDDCIDNEEKSLLLSNIIINKRRLGDKLSHKIYSFFFHC